MTSMDALVIGSRTGLAPAVTGLLRRRGLAVLAAVHADVADPERAAWLLAEAGSPALIVICESAPYAGARRLLGRGRVVLVADERRVPTARPDGRPARSLAGRELARAARSAGGEASVVRLGRAGGRWVEQRPGAPAVGARTAAAIVLAAAGRRAAPAQRA